MKTDDLTDYLWAFVWVTGYKPHFCPKKLANGLLADLSGREHDTPGDGLIFKVEGTDSGGIDLPGMCMVDRPYEEIKIDTFKLSIPSQDFTHFVRALFEAPERMFADGEKYYKIHGWMHCIVFTPEQRDMVLKAMEEMLPEAARKAEEADREFSRRMEEINRDGVKVISHRDKYSKDAPKKVTMNQEKIKN